jgi:large subunit ribosomal protein L13
MKTFAPKQSEIKQEWYLVDVKGKSLGRVASKIAALLRGKNKPTFAPYVISGDYVVVVNAKEIRLTGNKAEQKVYYKHSRFPNGLKAITAAKQLEVKPEKVIEMAVAGMIPHNKLKKDILRKLKVFSGAEHGHEAQQPKPIEL